MKLIRTLALATAALCASVTGAFAQLNTQLKAQQLLGAETADLCVAGNFAYVARGDQGLTIIDVSNPAAPSLRGTFAPVGCHIHDVEVVGNLAYVANHVPNNSGTAIVGVYIADVSDPNNPIEAGRIEWGMGAGYHFAGSSHSIHVESRGPQRIIYVGSEITSQLEVFDVTAPNAAVYLSTIDNPVWTYWSQAHEMHVRGNLLFTTWLVGGLTIHDVSNLAAPVRLVHQPSSPNYMYDAKPNAAGTHLLTTEAPLGGGGILKIRSLANIGGTNTLPLTGTYASPNATLLHNIAVQGNYASISCFKDGLRVLNIANPAAPVLSGWYDTDPASAGGSAAGGYGVAVSGNAIFLSHSTGGLYVLDHIDTITITKAEWKNSNKTLTVEATSTGAPYLTLTVAGHGTMTYNTSTGRYVRVKTNVLSNPGTVTVTSDIGGSASSNVRRR